MLTKVHTVKAMVFPVVMYGCQSWTIKKIEHWRTDVFKLWCWRRLLRVPWTARRSNQSILKEINPVYSLEGLMLRLKLQSFAHLMQRASSLEKILMLGKTERQEKGMAEDEMLGWHHWLNGHEFEQTLEMVKDREAWCATVPGVTKSWTRLSNWTELMRLRMHTWKYIYSEILVYVYMVSWVVWTENIMLKWNKSDKERQILYDLTYTCKYKNNHKTKLIDIENRLVITSKEDGWRVDEMDEADQEGQTFICKKISHGALTYIKVL